MIAEAGGVRAPKVSAIPVSVLGAAGLVSRQMKEMAETGYMFARPFVVDSSASEERLGLAPTPLAVGLARTVAWWRAEDRRQDARPAA
jgi:nucleoside-diphosphate-sugar epimerase